MCPLDTVEKKLARVALGAAHAAKAVPTASGQANFSNAFKEKTALHAIERNADVPVR